MQGSAPTREDCGIQSAIEEASALRMHDSILQVGLLILI